MQAVQAVWRAQTVVLAVLHGLALVVIHIFRLLAVGVVILVLQPQPLHQAVVVVGGLEEVEALVPPLLLVVESRAAVLHVITTAAHLAQML
jgi:hypothetical protein